MKKLIGKACGYNRERRRQIDLSYLGFIFNDLVSDKFLMEAVKDELRSLKRKNLQRERQNSVSSLRLTHTLPAHHKHLRLSLTLALIAYQRLLGWLGRCLLSTTLISR
jgi:hypothetical protein